MPYAYLLNQMSIAEATASAAAERECVLREALDSATERLTRAELVLHALTDAEPFSLSELCEEWGIKVPMDHTYDYDGIEPSVDNEVAADRLAAAALAPAPTAGASPDAE